MHDKVSAELRDQLDRAGDDPVQAVVQLRFVDDAGVTQTPEDCRKLAESVLKRVSSIVGHGALRTNVLPNVASLIVEAAPQFIEALISQPEVIKALPNPTKEDLGNRAHRKS